MKRVKIYHILLALTPLLSVFFFQKKEPKPFVFEETALLVQNTYLGPTEPIPGNPDLVRIEILIKDSPDLAGVQIQSVTFDGQAIPLKPRDIFGKRGSASFQVRPGKYNLRWTVNRDKIIWPRTSSHEEEVIISPRDLWVQILIEGDSASIR
jgi:hypothetical protein